MKICVFDSETTGLVDFKISHCDLSQPAPVSIGAVVHDYLTGQTSEFYSLVKIPDDVQIHPKALEVHGITRERANDEGRNAAEVLDELEALFASVDFVTAYNLNFDDAIYKTMSCRVNGPDRDLTKRPYYNKTVHKCLMNECAGIFRIPHRSGRGFQPLKLGQAYKRIVGVELKDAHNALIDSRAAFDIQSTIILQRWQQAFPGVPRTDESAPKFRLLATNDEFND